MASVAEPKRDRPWSMPRVVIASSAGTAFEWYDFFIFGSLAPVIGPAFFSPLGPTPALIAAGQYVMSVLALAPCAQAGVQWPRLMHFALPS